MNNNNLVYKVTNKINNRVYIGQTSRSLEKRRRGHERFATKVKSGINNAPPFVYALAKHGKENFEWEVLAKDLSPEEADKLEQDEIKKEGRNCYNATIGGKERHGHSEETKAKIRAKAQAQWQDAEYIAKFKAGVEATKETTLAAVRASSEIISTATKKAYKNPNVKENAKLAKVEVWRNNDERRKAASERMKKIWADPEKKAERSQSIKKSKSKLKTYILTTKEFNSDSQEGIIIHSFKADSLELLYSYIDLWERGNEKQIPAGQYKVKHKLPARFWEAGSFCSQNSTLVCKETGEDMKVWWETQDLGTLKG